MRSNYLGGRGQTRTRVHLNESRLQILVDHHIEPIALEAVLICDDHALGVNYSQKPYLDALQGQNEDFIDVVEYLLAAFPAVALVEVKPDFVEVELSAVVGRVFVLGVSGGSVRSIFGSPRS